MRRKRLNLLIYLSALSAVALYVVQGALATGADVSTFPAWFWVLDYILWGARALIEAAVIVYLFTTTPTTRAQGVWLTLLEFALVALITFTVGPALRAVGLGRAMVDSVTPAAFTAWSFGIAAYTSLMVGAAGYAFRVEGDVQADDEMEGLRAENERLAKVVERQIGETAGAKARAKVACAENAQLRKVAPLLDALPQQTRAEMYARFDGNGIKAADVAQVLGISEASARRGVATARKEREAEPTQ